MDSFFRQPRFAEASETTVHVTGVGHRYVLPDKCYCNPWLAFFHLIESAPGFVQPVQMRQSRGEVGGCGPFERLITNGPARPLIDLLMPLQEQMNSGSMRETASLAARIASYSSRPEGSSSS